MSEVANGVRQGYKFGVAWIALNDAPGDNGSVDDIAGYVSTLLLADLFGKDNTVVAKDVFDFRLRAEFKDKYEPPTGWADQKDFDKDFRKWKLMGKPSPQLWAAK